MLDLLSAISNISSEVDGVKGSVNNAKESEHALSAANLDSDSTDWTTIDAKDTAILQSAKNYSDEQREAQATANDTKYLSKLSDDTAQGVITFLKGLLLGDGSWGIDDKGAATLLSIASQDWKITAEGLAQLARVVADEMMDSAFGGDDTTAGKGYHYWVDEYGRSHVVTDYFTARVKAFFAELEVRKVSASTGNIVFSNASSRLVYVEEWSDGGLSGYKCWFSEDDGTTATTNSWEVGDQALCRTFNIRAGVYTGVSNRYYWRLVVGKGEGTPKDADGNNIIDGKTYGYIILGDTYTTSDGTETTLVGSLADGDATVEPYGEGASFRLKQTADMPEGWTANDTPQAGDTVVQLGCQTAGGVAARGNAMQIATNGAGGGAVPSLDMYSAINDYGLPRFRVVRISPQGIVATVKKSQVTIVNDAGDPVSLFNWRGVWDSSVSYEYGDVVSYGGRTYAWDNAASGSTAGTPPDGELSGDGGGGWSVVAEKGGRGDDAVQVVILTDKGVTLRPGLADTTLTAHVYKGGEDVTGQLEESSFSWTRTSADTASDAAWNATHSGVGGSITVTKAEVFRRSMFECAVDTTALYQ